MPPRPELPHRPTSDTLSEGNKAEPDSKASSVTTDGLASLLSRRLYDTALLVGILIALVWPWIFFAVVYHMGGIQMHNAIANVVTQHPHSTNYFVTLIGSIVSLILHFLFSLAIIRLAQEWVTDNTKVTVFDVSVISAFRYQRWPWALKDLKHLFVQNRRLPAFLVVACVGIFVFIPSATTSLLTPVPFNRTVALRGTELDMSSSAPDCLDWLNAHRISNNCDWTPFKNMQYTKCLGENQMVDVIESGRGNILSLLSNNSETLAFSQLGAKDGLHFLGPIRGVLPLGPNGVPAFDTIEPSRFSDAQAKAEVLSYNYTLEHQGLHSNISCIYDTQSPIVFSSATASTRSVAQYNGTCGGGTDILTGVRAFVIPNGNSSLGFWACQAPTDTTQSPSYFIYLRGRANYAEAIGNISCTASPIQPAVFPVTYWSRSGIFSTKEPITVSRTTYPALLEKSLVALGGIIAESQNFQSNLVAESVITFGVKYFGLPPYKRSPQYLRLYEAMIQGILEYEVTYSRLIYSTFANPPSSCIRTVNGSASYQVLGWFVTFQHIGYLAPMTVVNLVSLSILLVAMILAKKRTYDFDPTDTRPLLVAYIPAEHDTDKWGAKVKYDPKL